MTIVPPRTGSSALAKPLEKIVPDDAANPRGKARAVRREILFEPGSATKLRTPQWCPLLSNWHATFCRCGNRAHLAWFSRNKAPGRARQRPTFEKSSVAADNVWPPAQKGSILCIKGSILRISSALPNRRQLVRKTHAVVICQAEGTTSCQAEIVSAQMRPRRGERMILALVT